MTFTIQMKENGEENSFHTISIKKDPNRSCPSSDFTKCSFDRIGRSNPPPQSLLSFLKFLDTPPLSLRWRKRDLVKREKLLIDVIDKALLFNDESHARPLNSRTNLVG